MVAHRTDTFPNLRQPWLAIYDSISTCIVTFEEKRQHFVAMLKIHSHRSSPHWLHFVESHVAGYVWVASVPISTTMVNGPFGWDELIVQALTNSRQQEKSQYRYIFQKHWRSFPSDEHSFMLSRYSHRRELVSPFLASEQLGFIIPTCLLLSLKFMRVIIR
jgi:hypothetical protein